MQLTCESSQLEDYLCEHETVNYLHPLIQYELPRSMPVFSS